MTKKIKASKTEERYIIDDDISMIELGTQISSYSLDKGSIIYLYGNLGSGKTTFVRGVLRGLGFTGNVKSPTYTLVETYNIGRIFIHHFDLYRLNDSEELGWIGIEDYFDENTIALIEWPEKGECFLPQPDKSIYIQYTKQDNKRIVNISNYK